jgi:hypothetical protein
MTEAELREIEAYKQRTASEWRAITADLCAALREAWKERDELREALDYCRDGKVSPAILGRLMEAIRPHTKVGPSKRKQLFPPLRPELKARLEAALEEWVQQVEAKEALQRTTAPEGEAQYGD